MGTQEEVTSHPSASNKLPVPEADGAVGVGQGVGVEGGGGGSPTAVVVGVEVGVVLGCLDGEGGTEVGGQFSFGHVG